MPRFKAKGMLERSAQADLWKHTLSQIPNLFGRLAYLASLRDPNSGIYRHHGLSTAFGRDESVKTLRESHEKGFREWLKLPLAEKSSDVNAYLAALEDEQAVVVSNWLRSGHCQTLIPDRATRAQCAQFLQELEILLQMLRNAAGAGKASRGSARRA